MTPVSSIEVGNSGVGLTQNRRFPYKTEFFRSPLKRTIKVETLSPER
jgi:hypothetical protein